MKTTRSATTKVIEVFADIWCPFTHVGLRRLVGRRDAIGADFVLRVRAWPLELVNGAPLDPVATAQKVVTLRDGVAPDLFRGFDPGRFPTTTLPALALAHAAYEEGLDVGEEASLLLRDALFEDGLDIAQRRVLDPIAGRLHIARPQVVLPSILADWREGRHRGVVGSPHFFVDGTGFFCPSLHIGHVGGALEVTPDLEAFDAFVARCAA